LKWTECIGTKGRLSGLWGVEKLGKKGGNESNLDQGLPRVSFFTSMMFGEGGRSRRSNERKGNQIIEGKGLVGARDVVRLSV